MINAFTKLFFPEKIEPILDMTIYQIITNMHEYQGQIIIQDEVMLKLKDGNKKIIKVLKSNINQINICKPKEVRNNASIEPEK